MVISRCREKPDERRAEMMETTMGRMELQEMEEAVYLSESEIRSRLGDEAVEEVIAAFVEYRYPSDYRDDAPLPEDFEDGVEVTGYEVAGSIYVEATDADGHGDGTGELTLLN
jgi:hypothetical protein